MEEARRKMEEIRNRAIRATIEPDEWVRIDDAIIDLQNYLNRLYAERNPNAGMVTEWVRSSIINDMLLSFVCSMAGGTSPIVSSAISSFFTVDKKWVGVEDESSAVDLMYIARYDMVDRLNGFSYKNMIQFIIGMRYYICKFGLDITLDDVRMFYDDLYYYFKTGRIMESDEHCNNVFIDVSKIQVDCNNNEIDMRELVNVLIDSAVRYIRIACNEITHSQYNHNSIGNRLFAVNKFEQELNKAVENGLGEFLRKKGILLNGIPTITDPHVHCVDGTFVYNALKPVCDLLIRLIMYSHILNGSKMNSSTVKNSVYDAVMIRRELENERTNIKYQESSGGQNVQRRVPIQRARTQFKYPGQGLNTGFYI